MADELNTPLGAKKKAKLPIHSTLVQKLVAGALSVAVLVTVVWAVVVDDPFGGEPMVVVDAKPPAAKIAADKPHGGPQNPSRYDGPDAMKANAKATDADDGAAKTAAAHATGGKTITIIDGSSGKSQQVMIPETGGGQKTARADPRLLETTRHGDIPKIAADGARAAKVYAQAPATPPDKNGTPKIAIIVGGLGIGASSTAEAFEKLPPQVTFAFAPYGGDVGKLAARARAEKHEVLLQAPMEPFDYPDNDPGPQTLLTTLSHDQNIDRLHWLMSRFQGYVGITNYMGARFTASEQALAPVLRETAKRGLIFVDDGSSPRSAAGQIAGSHNLPFAKAEVVLDAVPTPKEIDRALARLEMMARERGTAVGIASAQPVTIARIAAWARKAQSRGFVLVPISAAAKNTKAS